MLLTNKYLIRTFAVGFITLVIFSIIGFWIRRIYYFAISPDKPLIPLISPSGLVPEYEPEPNTGVASYVQVRGFEKPFLLYSLGIFQNFIPDNRNIKFSWADKKVHYDKQTGLICVRTSKALSRDYNLYVGSERVSETPSKDMGKFTNPLLSGSFYSPDKMDERTIYLYDSAHRRFFKIDLNQKLITKGPEIDIKYNPVQVDILCKNTYEDTFELYWSPPVKSVKIIDEENPKSKNNYLKPVVRARLDAGQYLLVLDKSGYIYLFDKETLQITSFAGRLVDPAIGTAAKHFASYQVLPVTLTDNNKYRGICIGTLSRDLDMTTISVSDSNGRTICSNDFLLSADIHPANEVIYYLLENLHPLALNYLSFFTASAFEALDGYRAIFALPNSCFAQNARRDLPILSPSIPFDLFILPLPSILLGVFLAVKVRKNMSFIGFSPRAKLIWTIAVISFGLVAYITYHITKPKITLVTCSNCGQLRRPDMDICHHCKNPWIVPEIIPQDWQVIVK